MRLLVIDNYDSFTYNLVHFLGELGAQSTVFRNDKITVEEIAALGPWPRHFRLLTLGQCIPLVSHLDYASHYRELLGRLAQRALYWCDIGFPPDGACYARTDPFLPYYPQHKVEMKLLSARFFRYYGADRYRKLRRDKFRIHFAYLASGDTPSPVDFIALTAGSRTLPESVAMFEAA